jgi:hypothetical protein
MELPGCLEGSPDELFPGWSSLLRKRRIYALPYQLGYRNSLSIGCGFKAPGLFFCELNLRPYHD